MTLFWDLGSGPGETQILRVFSTSSRYISPTHENSGSRKCAYLFWCAKNPTSSKSQNLDLPKPDTESDNLRIVLH